MAANTVEPGRVDVRKMILTRIVSALAVGAFLVGIEAIFGAIDNDYYSRLVAFAGIYVTLAVSLNIINGICGQFSIGHAAFWHIGAYTTGYISVIWFSKANMPPLIWIILLIPVGMAAAALAGLIVGLPSLKLKGDYLAIVTLGFGEIIRIVTTNIEAVGAAYGLEGIEKYKSIWLVWLLAIVCIAISRNLVKSAHGLQFLAVREDEVAASAMGVNVTRTKVTAFLIGSAFAGAAGVLFAHHEGFISPDHFKMELSFIILTMVVLGGTGSITGATLAAIALFTIPEALRDFQDEFGAPLLVTAAAVIASIISGGLVIFALRKIRDVYHGPVGRKIGLYAGALAGGLLVQFLLSLMFKQFPGLVELKYDVVQLRMVIFAATLIAVMLLRPQGILAHHEFSWTWFLRIVRAVLLKLRLIGSAGLSRTLKLLTVPAWCFTIVGIGVFSYGVYPTSYSLDELTESRKASIGYESYTGARVARTSPTDVPVAGFVYTMPNGSIQIEFFEILSPKKLMDDTELTAMQFERLKRPSDELIVGFLSTVVASDDATIITGPDYRISKTVVSLAMLLASLASLLLLLGWAQQLEPTRDMEAAA
ncbi:MAG: branched-chain amino acid ABC transporter permease [Armatimonadetes bacterium]|nr:branched-chain amino acid ABC transporter permease [Armatimonadota bacterium]